MCGPSQDDQDVEQLMRTAPDVKTTWVPAFRPSNSIEEGTEYVQGSLKHDPSEPHALIQLTERVKGQGVNDGDDTGCAETDEHRGAVGAPGGSAEVLKPRDSDASKTQETDHAQVKSQQVGIAKEAIVHGWHIAPDNEKDDSGVVQLVSPLGHLRAVVAQGMVGCAHTQTAESA